MFLMPCQTKFLKFPPSLLHKHEENTTGETKSTPSTFKVLGTIWPAGISIILSLMIEVNNWDDPGVCDVRGTYSLANLPILT